MSYILDALRKADAQRERDPARGIHAQPVQPALQEPVAQARPRAWLWIAVLAGGASLAAAAWQLLVPQPAPAARQATSPVVTGQVVARSPAAPAAPAAAILPAPPAPAPVPPPAARETPKPAAPQRPAASASSQPASAPARLLSAKELPPDLPKLAITGGVYSQNPSQRMLIVNGQVVNEGAQLAPGVVLEEIRPRSAVLQVRGYRYAIGY